MPVNLGTIKVPAFGRCTNQGVSLKAIRDEIARFKRDELNA